MVCPKCSGSLEPRFSHGIEVDVCVECGGAWLDRGEIDKLAMRSQPVVLASSDAAESVQDGDPTPPPPKAKKSKKSDDEKKSSKKKKSKKKRKKGWADELEDILEDVLDFDDLFEDILDFD